MKTKKKQAVPRAGGTHLESQLQKARVKAGVTQESAAEALCCSARTLQRYEQGKTFPDLDLLSKMKELYQCEYADLFPGIPYRDKVQQRADAVLETFPKAPRISDRDARNGTYGRPLFSLRRYRLLSLSQMSHYAGARIFQFLLLLRPAPHLETLQKSAHRLSG